MVGKFPEFSRFSLNFFKKVPFSRFSRFSLSRTNPVKGLYPWKLLGLGVSNMNFLIADVIQFGTIVSFSKEDGAKIKSKQFLAFGSYTMYFVLYAKKTEKQYSTTLLIVLLLGQ